VTSPSAMKQVKLFKLYLVSSQKVFLHIKNWLGSDYDTDQLICHA